MTTKQIDYCIELAHTLNFSRAAENAFVSQPTFSYQIRLLEEEVGFTIFERSGKGATLTPAGTQFVSFLSGMREDLKRAIEQGQNFSAKYRDSISISLMVRQAVYFLPEAMRLFAETNPDVQITPVFQYENGVESFLRNETDILFALKEQTRQIPGISVHELFVSHIYLIAQRDDPLAQKNRITESDLYGRTLMVGGGSPPALRAVQHRLIASGKIDYFNSADHDTTLTNVAAGRGICLAPGFLNDHSGQFAWIMWHGGHQDEPKLLYDAYRSSLELAQENGCRSIGFPLISAGIFGYPIDKAWRKAIQACNDFIQKNSLPEQFITRKVFPAEISQYKSITYKYTYMLY